MKKYIIYFILLAIVVVAAGAAIIMNKKGSPINTPSWSESPTPTATPTPTVTSSDTKTPTKTATPKPGIKTEEVNSYNYLFNQMDPQNRVLGIYNECDYIVPSNVTYKNNTEVMLDNTRSKQTVVLKIGNKDYTLAGGAWNTVTLSSPTVPATMQIFCKSIELGSIDLN